MTGAAACHHVEVSLTSVLLGDHTDNTDYQLRVRQFCGQVSDTHWFQVDLKIIHLLLQQIGTFGTGGLHKGWMRSLLPARSSRKTGLIQFVVRLLHLSVSKGSVILQVLSQ